MINKKDQGFTLIELLLVMGLVTMLFVISGLSLSNLEKEDQLDLLASQLKTSLLAAQARTINGEVQGVFFLTDKYILFYGDQFLDGNPDNEVIDLPQGIFLTNINFPSQAVAFAKITGYVKNFNSPCEVILLEEKTGKTRKVLLNKLGVVNIQ